MADDKKIILTRGIAVKIGLLFIVLLLVLSFLLTYTMTGKVPIISGSPPVNLTIHSAYRTSEIQGFKPKSGGYFLVANMTVENLGDNPYPFNENTVHITNGRLSNPQFYTKLNGFPYWDMIPPHSVRTREVLFGTDSVTQDFTITLYYNGGKDSVARELGVVPVQAGETQSTPAAARFLNATINFIHKTTDIGGSRPYAGKTFIVANMTIENSGDTDYNFTNDNISITGGSPLTEKLYDKLDDPFYWGSIPAHGATSGEVVFSVLNSTPDITITFMSGRQIILKQEIGNLSGV